jgi:large subunit ribosomal protein L29
MATATELNQLPEKELTAKIAEIRERLFNMSFKATTEPISNPAEVRELRKDLARIQASLGGRRLKGAPKRDTRSREERTAARATAAFVKARDARKAALKAANAKPKGKSKAQGGAKKTARPTGKTAVAEKKA